MNKNAEKNKEISLYGVVDERTKAVVYQGDAYTARFMLFAVLFDVVIRGLGLNDPITTSNWDLMLIVFIGSLVSMVYQIKNKVLFNRPCSKGILYIVLIMVLAAVVAFLTFFFFTHAHPV